MWGRLATLVCLATGLLAAPERPEAGLSCPQSQGLFSHPTNCHLFLHCDHDHPYVKECPADLHFNAALMVCDWPQNAGCTGGTPTVPPTPDVDPDPEMECDCECCLKPSGDDCTTYYICKDSKAYKATCAPGLVFNPEIENCDLASNYQCEDPTTTTPKPVTTKPTTARPPKPDFDCPEDGLYPNPKDCHTFYHCSNGHAYLKDCPANLEFNPVLLVCDWPENAGCNGKPTPSPAPPTTRPTPKPDVVCPDDTCECRVPDPSDCSKFYQCKDGKAYPESCPAGLVYNPETEMCDYPEDVPGCQNPTTARPTTRPTTKPTPKPTTKPTPKPTTKPTPKPTTKPTPKPTTKPTPKPTTKPTPKPKPPKPDSSSSEESGSGSGSSESGSKSKHSGSKSKHSGSKSKHSGSKSKHSGSKSKHSGSKSKHSGSKSKHSGSKSKHDKRSAELMAAPAPVKSSPLYRNPDHGRVEDDDGFLETQFCPRPNGKFPSAQCHFYYHCVDGVPTRKRCLHGTRFYARDQRCILGSC